MVVVSCFDIRFVRRTSLENEAIAMLHAVRLESIVCLFVRVIEKVQRGWNSFHGHMRRRKAE
jgi:hypothetical protein